jgi:hypothetical protein
MNKTLNNTTENQAKDQVSDLEIWGESDLWKLICKASSKQEGWMKSTKAMFTGTGCFVQVTTQQLNDSSLYPKIESPAKGVAANIDLTRTVKHSVITDSIAFAPGVQIEEHTIDKKVVSRRLVPMTNTNESIH